MTDLKSFDFRSMGWENCWELAEPLLSGTYPQDRPGIRTKFQYPYNYDPFTIWCGPGVPTDSVYTDRLLSWDFEKHNRLCEKYFGNTGQRWGNRDPKKVEQFLRDWFENPSIRLCEIVECCNQSNGFPLWCLMFSSEAKEQGRD